MRNISRSPAGVLDRCYKCLETLSSTFFAVFDSIPGGARRRTQRLYGGEIRIAREDGRGESMYDTVSKRNQRQRGAVRPDISFSFAVEFKQLLDFHPSRSILLPFDPSCRPEPKTNVLPCSPLFSLFSSRKQTNDPTCVRLKTWPMIDRQSLQRNRYKQSVLATRMQVCCSNDHHVIRVARPWLVIFGGLCLHRLGVARASDPPPLFHCDIRIFVLLISLFAI